MINIVEQTNYYNVRNNQTDFIFYCGAICNSETGYCNYILDNLDTLDLPTDNNYQKWFMIDDFLNFSDRIKIVRPINTTLIANADLKYAGLTATPTKEAIKDCYNPTIAETTIDLLSYSGRFTIISKNVQKYGLTTESENIAVSVCSTQGNYDDSIFADTDLTIFDTSLLDNEGNLKSYRNLTSGIPNFSIDEFCLIVLKKDKNKKWKFQNSYILSYDTDSQYFADDWELDFIYLKLGDSTKKVDTSTHDLSDNSFENYNSTGISTNDYTLVENDYINALNVLKADSTIKGILSFEFDDNVDLVGEVFTDDNVFNFVGPYDVTRFISTDISTKMIDDFKEANGNNYFTNHRNNVSIITNMYKKYDVYNCKNRWLPFLGIYGGLVFQKKLKKPIDLDDVIGNYKLLFKPTESDRKYFAEKKLNLIIDRKGISKIYGNKIIHDKLIIKNLFNSAIIEELRYKLLEIQSTYSIIHSRELNNKRETIINEIQDVLKSLREYTYSDSINFVYDTGVLKFWVTVWLKSLVENFDIEINFNIG